MAPKTDDKPTPIRGFAKNEAEVKRIVEASALTERHIYRLDKDQFPRMRRGELLGVVNGLRIFGASRRSMVKGIARIHEMGAAVYDVETGLRSDRDGVDMLDIGLSRLHREASMSPGQAIAMQKASVESRLSKRMPNREALVPWRDPAKTPQEAVEEMWGWSIGTAYRVLGPRGTGAGRKPKGFNRRLLLRRQAERGMGAIYFLRMNGKGKVKIGYATNVESRVKALQTACPQTLHLLAFIEGTEYEERALHRQFRAYREDGEWFRVEGKLKEYMAKLPKLPDE